MSEDPLAHTLTEMKTTLKDKEEIKWEDCQEEEIGRTLIHAACFCWEAVPKTG